MSIVSRTSLLLAVAATGGLGGCGEDASSAGRDDASPGRGERPAQLAIATTVAPLTSIVAAIGGDRVRITGIVPEGTNSHTFEPRPSVAELLARVDVVYVNGLGLEDPTLELARENINDAAEVVELGSRSIARRDHIYDFAFPRNRGKPNPHLWTDPKYARRYAAIVRADLSRRDPAGAPYYAANYVAFAKVVQRLDRAMRTSFATIPRARRRLLTYHDAYAYFARDYGWDVVGAIQVSDFEDPTPKQVARLIDQIRTQQVPAVFGSEVFPSTVLEQIGREAGVRYVDVLRDDDLPGSPGDPEHSWVGLMRFDYLTMTEAMGGDASALSALQPHPTAPDRAEYPQ